MAAPAGFPVPLAAPGMHAAVAAQMASSFAANPFMSQPVMAAGMAHQPVQMVVPAYPQQQQHHPHQQQHQVSMAMPAQVPPHWQQQQHPHAQAVANPQAISMPMPMAMPQAQPLPPQAMLQFGRAMHPQGVAQPVQPVQPPQPQLQPVPRPAAPPPALQPVAPEPSAPETLPDVSLSIVPPDQLAETSARRKPRQCGSYGCTLPDQHSGLCQIPLEAGPRVRRPAKRLSDDEASCSSPRGGGAQRADAAAGAGGAPETDAAAGRRRCAMSDQELLSLPDAKGYSEEVLQSTIALFRQWCPEQADGEEAEEEAEDGVAHVEWAARSLTKQELSSLARCLVLEARRRHAPRNGANGGANGANGRARRPGERSESPSSASEAEASRLPHWSQQPAGQRGARSGEGRSAKRGGAELARPRRPQLKAAQAKVNSRVVVVYEEEDEAAGGGAMVQVPYAGVVTKVAAAKGMLVLFEGGESVWVDERAGDEWWYETPPKPPASQAAAASDEAASSTSRPVSAVPGGEESATRRQKAMYQNATAAAGGQRAPEMLPEEAVNKIKSDQVEALLSRLEAQAK